MHICTSALKSTVYQCQGINRPWSSLLLTMMYWSNVAFYSMKTEHKRIPIAKQGSPLTHTDTKAPSEQRELENEGTL